jgi:hypothetical protein
VRNTHTRVYGLDPGLLPSALSVLRLKTFSRTYQA